MDNNDKWNELKADMELAVQEGFERGFNFTPERADGVRFIVFRYVLDKMDKMDSD